MSSDALVYLVYTNLVFLAFPMVIGGYSVYLRIDKEIDYGDCDLERALSDL